MLVKKQRRKKPLKDRILEAVLIDGSTGCWNWQKFITPYGYGQMGVTLNDGTQTLQQSHRVSYAMFRGPIAGDLCIDHLCRNRACVNPDHLEQVTLRENALRGESLNAVNARKTHCKHGHEFTPENTYFRKDSGHRNCIACRRTRNRRQTEKLLPPGRRVG